MKVTRQALLVAGSVVGVLAAGGVVAAMALTPSGGSTIKHVKQAPAAVVQQVQAPNTATSAVSPSRVSSSVTVHRAAVRPAEVQDSTTDSPVPVVTPPTVGVTTEPNGQASPTSWPTVQLPPQSPIGTPSMVLQSSPSRTGS